jgi:beta-galactosidase
MALLMAACLLQAQVRPAIILLDKGWYFTKDDAKTNKQINWQQISIPHTWNAKDVMDDTPSYYRNACWYKKTINLPSSYKNRKLFLYFEGANQETTVFVNGKKTGEHIDGYTRFCIPITDFLQFDGKRNSNEILVKVDNKFNENIPPLTADFTFYGGIYRSVYLVATNDVHFNVTDNASNGIYISTPQVSAAKASIYIKGSFINETALERKIKITSSIIDKSGKKVASIQTIETVQPNSTKQFVQESIDKIIQPKLWSPENPYLYTVSTKLEDASTGKPLDEVDNQIGFRWFSFDANNGFFLNGKNYKLVGTSRHQDYQGMGNAVPDNLAIKDVELIKEMGGNFLRVAHYPQDPSVLEACDRLGLLTSVEIPIVNEITESETFYDNCKKMQVEMIRQNFNHPSVIIWCYMNEVLLKPHFNDDKQRQQVYFSNITKLAASLDSITRLEDPYRYTMIANHGDFKKYKDAKLIDIPMLVGWNLYSGWYGSKIEDFPAFLDRHHDSFPNKPLLVTEYGADADPRIRSNNPVRFDKSIEYTTKFHQYYMMEMMKRPFVAAAMIWNLADFSSETRNESMPHINNKGLLTWNRQPKDVYYLYQALLLKKPFVKILFSSTKNRVGIADSGSNTIRQTLQVASNLESLAIHFNGEIQPSSKIINGFGEYKLPFKNGVNRIKVIGIKEGKQYVDTTTINYCLLPYQFTASKDFKQMNLLLGADRFFLDDKGTEWMPSQPYHQGAWGSIAGKAFKMANNNRLPYGSDKNIIGTENDPIYQTQFTGIEQYKFDVPKGNYELALHFTELLGNNAWPVPYNLTDTANGKEKITNRVFNVYVNDVLFLSNFNMAAENGIATAICKKKKLQVVDDKGITVTFKSIDGETVLNAIQLKKLDNDNAYQ